MTFQNILNSLFEAPEMNDNKRKTQFLQKISFGNAELLC